MFFSMRSLIITVGSSEFYLLWPSGKYTYHMQLHELFTLCMLHMNRVTVLVYFAVN